MCSDNEKSRHEVSTKQLGMYVSSGGFRPNCFIFMGYLRLEDLKVLRRSPDLFNNVKLGQGFTARNKTYFVIPYIGVAAILVK